MTFHRENFVYFIAFILIGAVLGSALGTLAVRALPSLAFLKLGLTAPIGFSLDIMKFSLILNPAAIAGMVIGFILFWKI